MDTKTLVSNPNCKCVLAVDPSLVATGWQPQEGWPVYAPVKPFRMVLVDRSLGRRVRAFGLQSNDFFTVSYLRLEYLPCKTGKRILEISAWASEQGFQFTGMTYHLKSCTRCRTLAQTDDRLFSATSRQAMSSLIREYLAHAYPG